MEKFFLGAFSSIACVFFSFISATLPKYRTGVLTDEFLYIVLPIAASAFGCCMQGALYYGVVLYAAASDSF